VDQKHDSNGYIGSQSSRGEATRDTSERDSVRQRRIKEKSVRAGTEMNTDEKPDGTKTREQENHRRERVEQQDLAREKLKRPGARTEEKDHPDPK
jgi:hypothetical protein